MAIAQQYPTSTPKPTDLVIGTSIPDPNTNDDPKTVNFPISDISTLVASEVPQGPAGPAGADGADGANGTNGTNGTNGVDGQDGAQGAPGADGTSINILGTKPTVNDLPVSGSLNDLWIIDQAGGGAEAGDGYVWTAENTWLNIGPLRGPQGVQGIQGAQGPAGTNGTDGTNGTNGAPGDTGPQGPQGIQGPTGATGGVSSVTAGVNVTVTPNLGDVEVSAPNSVENSEDVYSFTPKVEQIVSLTQAEYTALLQKDANTLYIIL